jgi:N-acetylglucosaminyldiphosphoundecaprenol N-acetyl-beta-D-mannosaminyltransferase
MTMAETTAWVRTAIEARRPVAHLCVNAAHVATAHDDASYLALLEDADVVGADGASMLWAGRVLGEPLPERSLLPAPYRPPADDGGGGRDRPFAPR